MDQIVKAIREHEVVRLIGLQGSSGCYFISRLADQTSEMLVILAKDAQRGEILSGDLAFYQGSASEVAVFPCWEVLPFDQTSPYLRLQSRRIGLLSRLLRGIPPRILIVPLEAWMTRVIPRAWLHDQRLFFGLGDNYALEDLVSFLQNRGYQRVPLVEEPGDFSVRGGILDCYSSSHEDPFRIELVGDRIESIRFFSVDSQRSTGSSQQVEILPIREIPWSPLERKTALNHLGKRSRKRGSSGVSRMLENLSEGVPFPGMEFLLPLFHSGMETLSEYLPPGALFLLDSPDELEEDWRRLRDLAEQRSTEGASPMAEIVSPEELYVPVQQAEELIKNRKCLQLKGLHMEKRDEAPSRVIQVRTSSQQALRSELKKGLQNGEALSNLVGRFKQWIREGLAVHWVLRTRSQAERLRDHLAELGLRCRIGYGDKRERFGKSGAWICSGMLSEGFVSPSWGVAFLTEEEVFGSSRIRRTARSSRKLPAISHLEELQEGDLVVHVDHGIGIYRGLRTLNLSDIKGDFLLLAYMGGDKLYVPVDRFQSVHKYMGTEGFLPRIDRLGGSNWENRKRRARKAVERMAKELLELYAARETSPGYAFSPPDGSYQEFVESFPYEETTDQWQAIREVMEDMSESRPMDRLVCGDVGFGKTEIAMRAAFRAVMDGKQVGYLVPTTILAEQHYHTFLERFRGYPIFIEALSRFRTPGKQRKILDRCRQGGIDILIGTHRLLQKDVEFKDLGLLMIDEEHRFGVAHKERLKRIRKDVDVLTLTATPIPRTLHMAMLGIRDLSVIETPPPERLSIRTVVAALERELVSEAAQRELTRGGQVFFVHNRIRGILRLADMVSEWVPDARVGIAHGQMPEGELSRVMEAFHRHEIDILVCTTIIQSGLDIPTANTILINNAHHLGLAEMHQIRGRVGRSGHQAYAYLLVPTTLVSLTQDAKKRLQTLQEFSELGSGYRIASRDLEIRGAGALLGSAQSGQIDAVGFELYTQLMRRTIAELKGETLPVEIEPEIHLPVDAYLPEGYVPDAHLRLGLYRRLSQVDSEERLQTLQGELEDRFGPLPDEGQNLLDLMALRCLAKSMGVKSLKVLDGRLRVTLDSSTPISPQGLVRLAQSRVDKGIRFVSEDTFECQMGWNADGSMPLLVKKGLKAILEDASISLSN